MLTGGRFLALLAGANPDSELIERLYEWGGFWVEPSFNMFGLSNKAVEDTGGVFEPASLLAFLVYLVIGAFIWLIVSGAGLARFRHAWVSRDPLLCNEARRKRRTFRTRPRPGTTSGVGLPPAPLINCCEILSDRPFS